MTFGTEVSLVHVDAEVAARDGRVLDGFAAHDFRVVDEGKEQSIKYFSAGQESLDLIWLFDISGSMRSKVKAVADAANEGVRELRPGHRFSGVHCDGFVPDMPSTMQCRQTRNQAAGEAFALS